jgi:hypothetical protein
MQSLSAKDFDTACEFITNLQLVSRRQLAVREVFEFNLIQQFLDEEALFIKQIPRVFFRTNHSLQIMYSELLLIAILNLKLNLLLLLLALSNSFVTKSKYLIA